MPNFSNCPSAIKFYGGANGKKIAIKLNGDVYMLKFPSEAKQNQALSYANSSVSEHLGSSIFRIIGIPAQETMLGTYNVNAKEKLVVACKDFTYPDYDFYDFASLKNSITDSSSNGYSTELEDILTTIDSQQLLPIDKLREHFWNMFIVDALIGNWDRHNDNWGILKDRRNDTLSLAPIFDCGSALYPQADEHTMRTILTDPNELNARIFDRPLSAIKQNEFKIRYFDFISSLNNRDCNAALVRIIPRINLVQIKKLIDGTPYITALQKKFYYTIIKVRKERILDFALNKAAMRQDNL